MSDFVSLYTALSGLRAAQLGLAVTADNIANVGTPGRTRQRVDLVANPSHYVPIGQIGGGVGIDGISSARNGFLHLQAREASSAMGRLGARADVLARLESLFIGEGDGIADGLGELWGAFEDLANDPSDAATRTAVVGRLDNLVLRIRTAAGGIAMVSEHTSVDMAIKINEVNTILQQVGGLNEQIFAAKVEGIVPHDLIDQRDILLDELSSLAAVRIHEDDKGMKRVSTGGVALVEGNNVQQLILQADGVTITTQSGLEVEPGGAIGGLRSALVDDVPAHQARLDEFAADLADILNAAHAAGFTPSGAGGGPLLSYDPTAAALTIDTVIVDGSDLAAAGDAAAALFDGDNAAAIGALRFEKLGAGGTLTLDDQFRQFLVTLGSETNSALSAADSQEALSSAVETQRMHAHGVSVDEEMMMLMNYQRSYEAAARVMTIIDETLDVLVNRLGAVGR